MASTDQEKPKPPEVEPVREALEEVVREAGSETEAKEIAREIEEATEGQSVEEARAQAPPPQTLAEAAQAVKEAEVTAPPGKAAPQVLVETARAIAGAPKPEREALAETSEEVFSPREAAEAARTAEGREQLQRAVIERMPPWEALDAQLFLQINHLPHTRFTNGLFYFLTWIFTGGAAWFGALGLTMLWDFRRGWRAIRMALLPLVIATTLVEYPVKWYFRRRRPFITIIRAIVVGRKPSTWSFPSGHSASAFAGAWLLAEHFPAAKPLLYGLASLVAFSRIYLGNHYPGDVVSGSALGAFLAWFFHRVLNRRRRPQP